MYYMKVSKLNQHFVNVICSGVEWKEINEENIMKWAAISFNVFSGDQTFEFV